MASLDKIAAKPVRPKRNKQNLGKNALKYLDAKSLLRTLKTVGASIMEKKIITPKQAEVKYKEMLSIIKNLIDTP